MSTQAKKERSNLSEQHRQKLQASAIAPDVARARGYRSIAVKADLKRLGFSDAQCRIPALLLPVWSVFGELANYQLRPDAPRITDRGKAVKYELPRGSTMLLDAHPAIRTLLGDPAIPLWITEGILKADAAVSVGLCCVALLGVWNWRGTNGLGGKTALPEWEAVALAGRAVCLAFDSDVMTKPAVYLALERLGAFLAARQAHVRYVYLPAGAGGSKVGLDDYLAAGHTVDDLLARATATLRRPLHEAEAAEAPYAVTATGTVWRKSVDGGTVDVPLANFGAVIREDVVVDDGAEEQRQFLLEATLGEHVVPVPIPAQQFAGMGWVAERLGAGAILVPGQGLREHLRYAIQLLSGSIPQRRVYAHTGWRQTEAGWVYLHAGGAIGADGAVPGIDVTLSPPLRPLALPAVPDDEKLAAAVRTAVRLLELLPPEVAVPLLGATWLAPLRAFLGAEAPDFTLWLHGPSGVFKSEQLALAMGFYGDFARTSLPANFSATANAVERFLFEAKDALLAIDDYHPAGDAREQAAMHQVANRILRGAGNASGRPRMRADTTLRPALIPRALPIVSGERLPEGHSNAARMFPVAVEAGSISVANLTQAQAERAVYPQAIAGYLRHLAHQGDALGERLPTRFRVLRAELQGAGHRREPGQLAHLLLGLETFFGFAVAIGAMTDQEHEERLGQARAVLLAHASEHAEAQAEEAPERLFLRLLAGGLVGKRAYLEHKQGGAPDTPEQWGWEPITRRDSDGADYTVWQHPNTAQLVGVIDEPWVLLFPEPVYQFVAGASRQGGRVFPVEQATLVRRLDAAGLLAIEREGIKRRRTVKAWISGASQRVLKLRAEAIVPSSPAPEWDEGEGGEAAAPDTGMAGDQGEGSSPLGGRRDGRGKDVNVETPGPASHLPTHPQLPTVEGEGWQPVHDLEEVVEWSA
jgi:hypothetical protein